MPTNKRVMDLSAHTPRTRSRGPLVSGAADDRGFMIVEVLVSAVLLIVISLATLAIIDRSGEASAMNRARSVATTLGQEAQDKIRQWPFSRINTEIASSATAPKSLGVATETIDNRTYEVETTLSIVSDSNVQTACLADWANKKVKIQTKVKAPAANRMKEVTFNSYRVPSIVDLVGKGAVIVKLSKVNGTGADLVDVTVGGTSKKTTTDGCAVFNDLAAGVTSVSWEKTGWVDENGVTKPTQNVQVIAGSIAQIAGQFDAAGSATVHMVNAGGLDATALLPSQRVKWPTATVVHSGISTVYNGQRQFKRPAAQTEQDRVPLTNLFPFASNYGVYAGVCPGNDPGAWGGTATSVGFSGATTGQNLTARLPTVKITLTKGAANTPMPQYRVYVREGGAAADGTPVPPMRDVGCSTERIHPTSTTNPIPPPVSDPATGTATFNLPYGVYRLCFEPVNTAGGTLGQMRLGYGDTHSLFKVTPDGAAAPYAPTKLDANTWGLAVNDPPAWDAEAGYWSSYYGWWVPAKTAKPCSDGW